MRILAAWWALCASVALTVPTFAQAPGDAPRIDAVLIQGLQRASESLVRAQMEVQAGQPFNPRAVQRDIRRLYELGFFTNIAVDRDSSGGQLTLTYIFEEKRLIEDVSIVGNRRVKLRDIRAALAWKEGDSFVEEGYDSELQSILDLYSSKGFLNATVDIVVEELTPSRVRLIYFIDEGRKAKVSSLTFRGNTVIPEGRLKKLAKTKPRWLFFLGGKYDENVFEEDLRKVLEEYGDYGRLEAEIPRTDFEYSSNGKSLDITVYIQEGPEYTVESMDVANNVVFDDDELLNSIDVVAGDVHNRGQVEEDATAVQEGYSDSGYVDAQVYPQVTLDRDAKTTNIVHQINEGSLKYIRQVKITGNDVTRDEVIRRNMLLHPGDRFDGAALEASANRMRSSGFFENQRVSLEDVPGDERFKDILLDVDEGRTGNFNFGGGFNTEEGFGGFAELRFNNFDINNAPTFSGGGQQASLRIAIGDRRTQYNLGFTDPEFLGYPFAFGFDAFDESYETSGGSNYTEDTFGGQIRLGKALSPYVTARSAILYTDVDIDNFGVIFQPDLRELRNPGSTLSLGFGITRNTTDNSRDATRGAVHDLALKIAGFGSDNEFVRIEHDSTWYWSLDEEKKWILSFRTREGIAEPYGGSDLVPLSDRFFAGGTTTVRGYDSRDIGPKVRQFIWFGDKQAIGGEARMLQSLELKYKYNDIMRLYTFMDAGAVWRTPGDFDFGDYKYSAGIGIGFDIKQFGPLRIDYGFALNPDSDQGSGRLHLTTGFRF